MPVLLKVGEVLTVVELTIRFFSFSTTIYPVPIGSDGHIWGILLFLIGLRWSHQAVAKDSLEQRRCIAGLFAMASILCQWRLPLMMLQANFIGWFAVNLFVGEAHFGLLVRFLLIPMKLKMEQADCCAWWSADMLMLFLCETWTAQTAIVIFGHIVLFLCFRDMRLVGVVPTEEKGASLTYSNQ